MKKSSKKSCPAGNRSESGGRKPASNAFQWESVYLIAAKFVNEVEWKMVKDVTNCDSKWFLNCSKPISA